MAQMDFMTYADVTNRYREIRENLEIICGLPHGETTSESSKFVIDAKLKNEVVSSLMQKLTEIPDAPTRASMSKEMVEMERVKDQAQMTLAGVDALSRELRATLEAITLQHNTTGPSEPIVPQDSES